MCTPSIPTKTTYNIPIIKLYIKTSTILYLNRISQEQTNEKEKKRERGRKQQRKGKTTKNKVLQVYN